MDQSTKQVLFFPSTASSSSTSTHNLFFQIKQSNHQKNNKYTLFFLFPFFFCSISSTFTIFIQLKNKQIKKETTRVNAWIWCQIFFWRLKRNIWSHFNSKKHYNCKCSLSSPLCKPYHLTVFKLVFLKC